MVQRENLYIKRLNSDRFLLITDQKTLRQLELTKFIILDEVREMTAEHKIPMTLSIGFAAGAESDLGARPMGQMSLDMSLDAAATKRLLRWASARASMAASPMPWRSGHESGREVIAHALRDMIRESDKVVIVGTRCRTWMPSEPPLVLPRRRSCWAKKPLSCWRASILDSEDDGDAEGRRASITVVSLRRSRARHLVDTQHARSLSWIPTRRPWSWSRACCTDGIESSLSIIIAAARTLSTMRFWSIWSLTPPLLASW